MMEKGSHGIKTAMEHMLHTRDTSYGVSILEESVTGCQLPREELGRRRVVFTQGEIE